MNLSQTERPFCPACDLGVNACTCDLTRVVLPAPVQEEEDRRVSQTERTGSRCVHPAVHSESSSHDGEAA